MDTYTAEALPVGESAEVAPGVVVERRCFLTLAAAAFGVAGFSERADARGRRHPPAHMGVCTEGRITLEEFLAEVVPVARELKADTSAVGEDRYLHTLASFAVRLGAVAPPEMRPSGQGPNTFIGVSWGGDPFVVLHWRMDPGAVVRLHAHTYGNVVTVGLEGRARVRNFETLATPDFESSAPVRLRLTNDQLLSPGRINLVPLSHGFVHGFQAGAAGARGLDITTRLRDKRPTPYLDVGEDPVDGENRVYEGRWTE